MRTGIIVALVLVVGISCGTVAARHAQAPPQTPAKKDAEPAKLLDGTTDPAAMSAEKAGDKSGKSKPTMTGLAPVGKTYTIGAQDVLQIWVIEQPNIPPSYVVRPDGIISIPMVGDINVTGMTTTQVEESIADSLKKREIVNDPTVTVGVAASHSRKYYISGEVGHPGEVDLVVPTRVSQALANAGGFKDFAKTNKIRIIREVPGGTPLKFKYNNKEVSQGKHLEQDIFLEPGDHIYVD